MVHRCTVERATAGTDAWGNPAIPAWATHLPALPCRAWYSAGREVTDAGKTAVVEDRRMIVPRDTDVREDDRVAAVTNRKGEMLFPGPMRIESVGRRRDHLDLHLQAV